MRAVDELASLVRGFNEMTEELEANSRELDAPPPLHRSHSREHSDRRHFDRRRWPIQRVNRALGKIFPAEQVAAATRLEDLFSREDTAEIQYLMKRARRTGVASRQLELRTGQPQAAPGGDRGGAGSEADLRLRGGARRHQRTAARAESRGLARSGAPRGARNQESADADRAFGRAHRAPAGPPGPAARNRAHRPRVRRHHSRKSVESVKTLVDEFSQFARFPAAQPVRCDLNEVVAEALAVFDGRLEGIAIRASFAPGPAAGQSRPRAVPARGGEPGGQRRRSHAGFAGEDAVSSPRSPAPPDTVELVVADTGCGVSPETKRNCSCRIFRPRVAAPAWAWRS